MIQLMGIVMFFGMIISTIVTLFFTPVYYSLMTGMTDRFHRWHQRRKANRKPRRLRLIRWDMDVITQWFKDHFPHRKDKK